MVNLNIRIIYIYKYNNIKPKTTNLFQAIVAVVT
jgi:hypothetical protein